MERALPTSNDMIEHIQVESLYGPQAAAMIKKRNDPRADLAIELLHTVINAYGAPMSHEMRDHVVRDAVALSEMVYDIIEEKGWVLAVPAVIPDKETQQNVN